MELAEEKGDNYRKSQKNDSDLKALFQLMKFIYEPDERKKCF